MNFLMRVGWSRDESSKKRDSLENSWESTESKSSMRVQVQNPEHRIFSAATLKTLESLSKLPGIGPKSAERIIQFLLMNKDSVGRELIESLEGMVEKVGPCQICFHFTEEPICSICLDERRNPRLLCVVEFARDISVIEKTGSFRGRYHVLNGRLAPLNRVGPDQLTLEALNSRIEEGIIEENFS